MQISQSTKPSFLKRQSVSLHLRYDLHRVKSGHVSQFSSLVHTLDKYDSHCGIPSELIKKIFCETISYINSKGTDNLQNIFDLTDLLQNKFEKKLNVYSRCDQSILQVLDSFSDMIIDCNKSGLFYNPDEVEMVHKTFLKIIDFHLKILLNKKHLGNLDGNVITVTFMFSEYKKFLENTIHIEKYQNDFEVLRLIQNMFDTSADFIRNFESELSNNGHDLILPHACDFLAMISTKYESKLKDHCHHSIAQIAQDALAFDRAHKHKVVHSLFIAKLVYEKFPHQLKGREHVFLEEIEDLMSNSDLYEKQPYQVQKEYFEIVLFYLKVLNDCTPEEQNRYRKELILKLPKLRNFDIFLRDLMKSGLVLKSHERNQLKDALLKREEERPFAALEKVHYEACDEIFAMLHSELSENPGGKRIAISSRATEKRV